MKLLLITFTILGVLTFSNSLELDLSCKNNTEFNFEYDGGNFSKNLEIKTKICPVADVNNVTKPLYTPGGCAQEEVTELDKIHNTIKYSTKYYCFE